MLSFFLRSFSALLLSSSAIAVPFGTSSAAEQLRPRAASLQSCKNPRLIDSSCWNTLQVADYLSKWNQTTPDCAVTHGDGSDCCELSSESWSTCFLRLATGSAGYQCGSLSTFGCSASATQVSDVLSPAIQSQVRYVTRAIFEINQLFTSYSKVLTLQNDLTMATILQGFEVDPRQTPLGILFSASSVPLSAGLSIANVTAWNTSSEITGIAQLWAEALQASPAVQAALWPNSSDNSQQISLSNPQSSASTSGVLRRALELIMGDVPTFLGFASNGRFTTPELPSIPSSMLGKEFDIATGLRTFVTSKLMQENDYYALPMAVADQATFESNNQCAVFADGACRPNNGKVFYWSPSTHRQYQLISKSGKPVIDLWTLMTHIQNDNWANSQLLFDGSYNCTAEGKAGGQIISQKADGGVDVSCVSQLPMYLQERTECPPSVPVGGKCPFGYFD